MKQYAYQYYGKDDGFQVWYKTPRQKSEKYRFFETMEALKKWAFTHKGKAIITSGSWQAFELMGQ